MSSWDTHLVKLTSAVKCRGAIYGPDALQWAGLTQVKATKAEIQKIIGGFTNPAPIRQTSPTLEGQRYMVTRAEPNLIVLKIAARGAVFTKSKMAIEACLFDEATTTPGQALTATLSFADYMRSIGY